MVPLKLSTFNVFLIAKTVWNKENISDNFLSYLVDLILLSVIFSFYGLFSLVSFT
jgi:hypothetical protein